MLNKIVKNASALILSLTLLLPVQMLGTTAQETEPKDKITCTLLSMIESSDDYFDVAIQLADPDYSDLYQQANDMFKDYPDWNGSGEDPVLERREFFQKLKNERWKEYVKACLSEAGISEERIISFGSGVAIWATGEEIYNIAANDKVLGIDSQFYIQIEYPYTAGTALKILRIAVGAETVDTERHMRIDDSEWVYDINQDGRITAGDACLALQSAVGHISIGPYDIALQRKARLLEKDALN